MFSTSFMNLPIAGLFEWELSTTSALRVYVCSGNHVDLGMNNVSLFNVISIFFTLSARVEVPCSSTEVSFIVIIELLDCVGS